MREHDLKCWPEYFEAIRDGRKPFEYRLNDRDFQVGDALVLREFVPDVETDCFDGTLGRYTGRDLRKLVTYILPVAELGPAAAVRAQPTPGFVIMGLGDPDPKTYWIVWNPNRGEGVVFDNQSDALATSCGEFGGDGSAIGEEFHEAYGEDGDLEVQEIQL